jgi:hypothetical protein
MQAPCLTSVADPVCLSRILIFIHPGSHNRNKKRRVEKLLSYLTIILLFIKKLAISSLRNREKSYSGSRGQKVQKAPDPGTGSRYATLRLTVILPHLEVEDTPADCFHLSS